jgi:transposase InsO family protein
MLVELGLMEQRHKAVLEVLGGLPVMEVARRYGVARQTVHDWLRRYATLGFAGLFDHSRRPATCPHQMRPQVEARIVALRRAHSGWGPLMLRHQLEQEHIDSVPSLSSIYRCLCRHGLIDPQKRRRRREDYQRWERSRSMELWQMDIMGGVKVADGSDLNIITGLDDHSRFCVSALVVPRATARPVCDALALAMRRHGVPNEILTDNGKVFTSRFGLHRGEVLFDRICRENGIKHRLTAPRSPTTTGKVERFHKTIRKEFLAGRVFASQEEAQAELDAWITWYNTERPHQGIGMVPPEKRFALATQGAPAPVLVEPEPEPEAELFTPAQPEPRRVQRIVSGNGRIRLAGFEYHVGRFLAGELVEAEVGEDGLIGIYHREVLVATHARRHPPEKEPAVWQKHKKPRQAKEPPKLVGKPVTRKVEPSGSVSFAGTAYRVGNAYRGQMTEVSLVGDTVQIKLGGKIIRTHEACHDKEKEHGAFANPGGRSRSKKAS